MDFQFPGNGIDARFPGNGIDARFPSPGYDARFPGNGVDARFDDASGGFGGALGGMFALWALLGQWDDTVPTGSAWTRWASWTVSGEWDDHAPTGTFSQTPGAVEREAYTPWDDGAPTT